MHTCPTPEPCIFIWNSARMFSCFGWMQKSSIKIIIQFVFVFFQAISTFVRLFWKLNYFPSRIFSSSVSSHLCVIERVLIVSCHVCRFSFGICSLLMQSMHAYICEWSMQANCAANNLNQQNNMNHCIQICVFVVHFCRVLFSISTRASGTFIHLSEPLSIHSIFFFQIVVITLARTLHRKTVNKTLSLTCLMVFFGLTAHCFATFPVKSWCISPFLWLHLV